MEMLLLPFSPRYIILTICAVVTVLLLGIGLADGKVFDLVLIPTLVFAALTALGIRDLTQKSHAVLRNYPISAHIRFLTAAGLEHPQDLRPIHFSQRTSTTEVCSFAKLYPSLRPGELIDGTSDPRYADAWAMARADSFSETDSMVLSTRARDAAA